VLKGLAPVQLIESYTSERIPVIAAMLNKTTDLLNQVFPLGGKITFDKFSRSTDLDMLGISYRGSPIVLDERTLDDGSIYNAYGNTDGELILRAGDRAPDTPGLVSLQKQSTLAFFDIFRPTYHTILVFGSDAITRVQAVSNILKEFPADSFRIVACLSKTSNSELTDTTKGGLGQAPVVVKDGEGHAYGTYLLTNQESGIFVVRPDGVLGAIVESVEGLERYLKLVFI
jgi:hypothetical protein